MGNFYINKFLLKFDTIFTMDRKKQLMNDNDEYIEEIGQGVQELNEQIKGIGTQVDDNMVVIKETNFAVEGTQKKLNFVMGKLGNLLKTSDNKQLWTILIMWALAVFQVILLI